MTTGAVTAEAMARAVEWLRAGRVVVLPTDTLYGLAVDPRSADAVEAVFDLKGRDATAALPLVAGSRQQVSETLGALPPAGRRLAEEFWPGPLALVVAAPPQVAPAVHAGTEGVAVRVPAHPVARELALAFGWPITATSANRSGAPAAVVPAELGDLARDSRVLVLDAGAVPGGAPSTIVDVRHEPPRLVRHGAVPWERVLESLHR